MPPKRKHKATKAKATANKAANDQGESPSSALVRSAGTVAKTCPLAAGEIRPSSNKRRNSSQVARPSRLLPSEPLHMTTRAASRAASNTASPAAAPSPSVAGSGSRRDSIDSIAHLDDLPAASDAENDRPTKRARLSTDSGSPSQHQHRPHQDGHAASPDQMPKGEKAEPSPASAPASPSASASPVASPPKATSIKRRRSSAAAGPSDEVPTKKGDPPHPNGDASKHPVHDDASAPSAHPRKRRKVAEPAPDAAADQPPELTDSSTPAGSPENIPEVEINAELPIPAANGDAPAKAAKRLPGRRRQPHSDINIETDLRRQLHLKMGYRSIAKALKPVLAELAERTIHRLETEPDYHKQCPEYDEVMAQLEQRKQARLAEIEAEKKNKLEQLRRTTKAQEKYLAQAYARQFREYQDDAMIRVEHEIMKLDRQFKAENGEATEDEVRICLLTLPFCF
jgi:hypothetical protein